MNTQTADCYGWAEIEPDRPVVAGEAGVWKIIYHVGRRGIDDGGVIKIAWRDVSDWEKPQFTDPASSGYSTVETTGPASVCAIYEKHGYVRPWRSCVTISVSDDSLSEGDSVTLSLGDVTTKHLGIRAQTYCQDVFEFRVIVDWCGTWRYTQVPSPKIPVVSGQPSKLVVVTASEVVAGECTWIAIKVEDGWGNPCKEYAGEIEINSGGLHGMPDSYRFLSDDCGIHRFECLKVPDPGIYRVFATDKKNDLQGESNPLKSLQKRGETSVFWGDLHGQSEETVGTNSVAAYFRFAREAAFLDFSGHQGNDFQITQSIWSEIKKQANSQNDPGKFVAFVGYEWSGNTPVGGDHNVYFPGEDGPLHRSSRVLVPEETDVETDCLHVSDLYTALNGIEALVIPHVGGRYANLRWHHPGFEPLIEVYSEWGEFEWFLREALERGYRVGFTAGSDDHKGRPGAAYPGSGSFGVYGGLTCVYASELTRAGIWEALKSRRCYGTTGPRILLRMSVDGHPMGAAIKSSEPPEIQVSVCGTAAVERVDLFRGSELISSYPDLQTVKRSQDTIRVSWSGQRIRARNRLVRWDGGISLEGGKIIKALGYAFDSAAEGIQQLDEREVTWRSVTTGAADGVILQLDAPQSALLRFDTAVVKKTLVLNEIETEPVRQDAKGIDVSVTFERLPLCSDREVSFTFRESELGPGCHPYWVRVLQSDGAKAWASPVYVTISPA